MGARVLQQQAHSTSSESEEERQGRQSTSRGRKLRSHCNTASTAREEAEAVTSPRAPEVKKAKQAPEEEAPSHQGAAALFADPLDTTKDDLLPFLDAEQDHLFLFPEEWHGDTSTLRMELKARQNKRQVFGRCSLKVDDVDEVLRQAHADLKKSDSLRYTLVKRNPDGKSARVATEDDVKDLSSLLSSKAKVVQTPAAPAPSSTAPAAPAEKKASPASSPARRAGSQYKPGGPCDHCGVCESPQWRRGPPEKPQLCNACGTRYRRTNNLVGVHGQGCSAAARDHAANRKREIIRGGHHVKADKKPRFDKKPLLLSASA